jgi:hypothetical protein
VFVGGLIGGKRGYGRGDKGSETIIDSNERLGKSS